MKKETGITLIALVIMIVILIILLAISIGSGSQSIRDVRLKSFYMQLELIQKRVDVIATTNETYIDSDDEEIVIEQQGHAYTDLIPEKQEKLLKILEDADIDAEESEFRYFTNAQLKKYIIDLDDFGDNVYIHFGKRIVIADRGIKIQNKTYHVNENNPYYAAYNANKNTGTIDSLSYEVFAYGTDKYKVIITPDNAIGDIHGTGSVQYKKTTTQYWEKSNDNTIIIEPSIVYQIIYTDAANANSIEKTIKVVASLLPTSYQQVEYIESTGTQYIDTGIMLYENYGLDLEAIIQYADNTSFIGAVENNGLNVPSLAIVSFYYNSTNYLTQDLRGTRKNLWASYMNEKHKFGIREGNKIYVDNDLIWEYEFSYSSNISNTATIFWVKGSRFNNKGKMKLYNASFYNNNNEKINNFIPCYCTKTVTDVKGNTCSAGTRGLYDLVTKQFYTNDGDGTFEKGNDVTENNLHVEEVI